MSKYRSANGVCLNDRGYSTFTFPFLLRVSCVCYFWQYIGHLLLIASITSIIGGFGSYHYSWLKHFNPICITWWLFARNIVICHPQTLSRYYEPWVITTANASYCQPLCWTLMEHHQPNSIFLVVSPFQSPYPEAHTVIPFHAILVLKISHQSRYVAGVSWSIVMIHRDISEHHQQQNREVMGAIRPRLSLLLKLLVD